MDQFVAIIGFFFLYLLFLLLGRLFKDCSSAYKINDHLSGNSAVALALR